MKPVTHCAASKFALQGDKVQGGEFIDVGFILSKGDEESTICTYAVTETFLRIIILVKLSRDAVQRHGRVSRICPAALQTVYSASPDQISSLQATGSQASNLRFQYDLQSRF